MESFKPFGSANLLLLIKVVIKKELLTLLGVYVNNI